MFVLAAFPIKKEDEGPARPLRGWRATKVGAPFSGAPQALTSLLARPSHVPVAVLVIESRKWDAAQSASNAAQFLADPLLAGQVECPTLVALARASAVSAHRLRLSLSLKPPDASKRAWAVTSRVAPAKPCPGGSNVPVWPASIFPTWNLVPTPSQFPSATRPTDFLRHATQQQQHPRLNRCLRRAYATVNSASPGTPCGRSRLPIPLLRARRS